MKIRTAGIISLVGLTAAVYAATAAYSFKVAFTEGHAQKMKVTMKSNVGGMAVELGYTSDEKITKVEADGTVILDIKTYDPTVTAGGAPVPIYGDTDKLETRKLTPTGELIESSDKASPLSLLRRAVRMQSIGAPSAPVEVGGSWSHEFPKVEKDRLPPSKVTYKFLGEEKVGKFDALKIEFDYTETEGAKPITGKGFLWLNKTDFRGVKGEAVADNFPAPPGSPVQTMSVTVKFERVE